MSSPTRKSVKSEAKKSLNSVGDGDANNASRSPSSQDVDTLFHLMTSCTEGRDIVKLQKIIQDIKDAGIIFNRDPRIRPFEQAALKISGESCLRDYKLEQEEFYRLMENNTPFLVKVLMKRLVIDKFDEFSNKINELYYNQVGNETGTLSDEIPEFQKVNRSLWGVAICSVDGQRKVIGDSTVNFTMQNLCKPVLLGLALDKLKDGTIEEYIAHEPSASEGQVLELNDDRKPFNTMVDTGTLMLCCLLTGISFKEKSFSFMQETYNEYLKYIVQNDYVDFKAAAYQSKKENADLLRCISHGIASECKIPRNCNVITSLDLYLKACSMEINAEGLSVLAATIANGGVNPFTEKQAIDRTHIKDILSSMYTFGLYDFSGENAFTVGLPMKCSSSGGLMVVVPGKMGVGLYSPLLNENGISARSYAFCLELEKAFKLHPYTLNGDKGSTKFILRREIKQECVPYCELFNSAAKADLRQILQLDDRKVDFLQTDDFGHTVLHVAAASGSPEIVKYLMDHYPTLITQKDKWQRVPRDYVNEVKQNEIARLFDRYSSRAGD